MASWLWSSTPPPLQAGYQNCGYNRHLHTSHHHIFKNQNNTPLCSSSTSRIYCNISSSSSNDANSNNKSERSALQLYSEIERVLTETVIQSQAGSGGSGNWTEVEGAWVLQPRDSTPRAIVHFVGGIFVGAAPQLTYRLFLERLLEKGIFVIATPYASGFDHFYIADEVQFKFDRCLRFLQDKVQDLPIFGIGHSLGSLVHLLIGSRYAVRRNGNVLMAFNNKEASMAIPLFSPVLVPMAQNIGPFLSQIASSPTIRLGAEMTLKQLQILSPPFVKQALPLFEQLPSLYMDLVNGREHFTPKPEETQRLVALFLSIWWIVVEFLMILGLKNHIYEVRSEPD